MRRAEKKERRARSGSSWARLGLATAAAALAVVSSLRRPGDLPVSVIVQSRDLASAAEAVRAVGGTPTHELGIIDAVAARLRPAQEARLRAACPTCRVYSDEAVVSLAATSDASFLTTLAAADNLAIQAARASATGAHEAYFPTLIGAAQLHAEGILGANTTVAVLDSGLYAQSGLLVDANSSGRVVKQYNALANTSCSKTCDDDSNGHGGHVAGIAVSSNKSSKGLFNGIAPGALLVSVKAFDTYGASTYATVIRGIDWVVANRTKYNIRVLNCSFGAPVRSWYWDDPINQAVMKAWRAGIVVVASAGNLGPDPMTVGVPGNVPYVVTVGAMTDNNTPGNASDDRLASFSSAGPTYEGFVKPDLVAPGGHILSIMNKRRYLPTMFPQFHDGGIYFIMSGTSQATAVVSGVAALILDKNPSLGPDDVKCALIANTRPAVNPATGEAAYSIFQQGTGVVDAYAAVHGGQHGCANQGLDIDAELAKPARGHYAGPAGQDASGRYYLINDPRTEPWNGSYNGMTGSSWSAGYPWTRSYSWTNGYPWTAGYPWTKSFTSSNGYPWTAGYPWTNALTSGMTTNVWVPQQ